MPSEFELIRRHFTRPTPQALLGPGDDCALLIPSEGMLLAVTTDMLVEGTHFLPDTDPCALGWKTLAVSLSDLAAMGARPRWALLAGSLPADDVMDRAVRCRPVRLRRPACGRRRRRRYHAWPTQPLPDGDR